ncbi:MAG: hypothetical protein M0T80_05740 [Actinomycetota bacterium]|nr:hypothetical protein [Actinomycetota bacterium]
MALATRSPRRAGGRRWLAVGLVITILVLLVDASVRSRSPGPTRRLDAVAWVDRVLPQVSASEVQGRELDAFFSGTAATSGAALRLDLDDIRSGSATTLRSVQHLQPPADLLSSAGLLESCLMIRAHEASAITAATVSALSAPIGVGAITRASKVLADAVSRLEVADQACALFGSELPGWLHVRVPASAWVPVGTTGSVGTTGTAGSVGTTGTAGGAATGVSGTSGSGGGSASPAAEAAFLTALHRRVDLKAVSAVTIEAVSTEPPAVSSRGGLQILTPDHHLMVSVVIGNTGNQTLDHLVVTGSISPAAGAATATATVGTLRPGSSYALSVGPLDPPVGAPVTLSVTVAPPSGSAAKVKTSSFSFEMPSPGSSAPSSTSSTTATSSTTSTSGGTTGTASSTGITTATSVPTTSGSSGSASTTPNSAVPGTSGTGTAGTSTSSTT